MMMPEGQSPTDPPNGSTTAPVTRVGFDGHAALEVTRSLLYPRRIGSAGERRAAAALAAALHGFGLVVSTEPVRASLFPMEFAARVVLALVLVVTVAGLSIFDHHPAWAALAWAGAAAAIMSRSWWRWGLSIGREWPPRITCDNLVARPPVGPPAPAARVVFMAHYDTKSQLYPTGLRVALLVLTASLCAALAIVAIVQSAVPPAPRLASIAWAGGLVLCAVIAALLFNVTGNRSPGGLDNGSGIGALLELARHWRAVSAALADAEVVYVATAAEEVGLVGAARYVERHADEWRRLPTVVLNLESIGLGRTIALAGSAECVQLARSICTAWGTPTQRLRGLLGVGMDHEPIIERGFAALSILGDVVRQGGWRIHSARDDLRGLDPQALERAGTLALEVARQWLAGTRGKGRGGPRA